MSKSLRSARSGLAIAFLASLTLAGCSTASSDASAPTSPAATISAMLDAAEAGDWGRYVDDFYGESAKFRSSADRDTLVQRYEERYGAEALEVLREAVKVEPKLSPDGKVATFTIPRGDFRLYQDAEGRWGFHM